MKPARLCGLLFLLVSLVTGAGASAATKDYQMEPGTGLAFGAFDITQSEIAVTHVVLMRVKPARAYMGLAGEKATVTYNNGEFFSPNLRPGLYSVIGFFSGDRFFGLERDRTNAFAVEPGRVAYAGTYKLKATKGGFFRRDKGTFERVDSPEAEAVLLRWLAKELANTGWSSSIKAHRATSGKK